MESRSLLMETDLKEFGRKTNSQKVNSFNKEVQFMMENGWVEELMVKEKKSGLMGKLIKECSDLESLGEQELRFTQMERSE